MKTPSKKKDVVSAPDFLQISHQIIIEKRLSAADKFVYGAICYFNNMKTGSCFASNKTLGDLICMSEKAVSNSLLALEKTGYIIRTFSDDSHRRRTEIIPTAVKAKKGKKMTKGDPSGGGSDKAKEIHQVVDQKKAKEIHETVDQIHETVDQGENKEIHQTVEQIHQMVERDPSNGGTSFSTEKSEATPDTTREIDQSGVKSDPSDDGERYRGNRILSNNIKIESPPRPLVGDGLQKISEDFSNGKFDQFGEGSEPPLAEDKNTPAGDPRFTDQLRSLKRYETIEDIPAKVLQDAISLFLPVFPNEFMTKNPFAIPATRKAVSKTLLHLSYEELKAVTERYLEMKTDRFRPDAGSIYDFCTYKLAKIEAFVGKSAGNLWAQRSIDTPESEKVRKEQYANKISKSKEKVRLAKEEWDRNHPVN